MKDDNGRPARRGGREAAGIIGVTDSGAVEHWASMKEAAACLGTTPWVLYVYMYRDAPYRGYYLDYEII